MTKILKSILPMVALFVLTINGRAQPLVNIETVRVGDAGNADDTAVMFTDGTTGYGKVTTSFDIGKYEVTISQYNTFLNSVASISTDSYIVNLWSTNMEVYGNTAGISRIGSGTLASPYNYSVIGSGNRPISCVSWFDAARFANWVNNGANVGASTENGAYKLNGATTGIYAVTPGATWFLPSEDQWYKAAYYKGGGTNAGYWLYPTQSNEVPTAEANPPAAANSANYNNVRPAGDKLTEVGAYSNSPSAYGTFDQGGNLIEWNDAIIGGTARGLRGTDWQYISIGLQSLDRFWLPPDDENGTIGFRVATVPEPSTYALLALGAGALMLARRRRQLHR